MNFSARFAREQDYLDVTVLVRQIHKIHVAARPDLYSPDPNPMGKAYYDKLLKDPRAQVAVAVDARLGKAIAYSVIRMEEAPYRPIYTARKYIFIDDFCVDEKYRGQGVGTLLFEFIREYGKSTAATCIELGVSEFNEQALAFYDKLGLRTRSRKLELEL